MLFVAFDLLLLSILLFVFDISIRIIISMSLRIRRRISLSLITRIHISHNRIVVISLSISLNIRIIRMCNITNDTNPRIRNRCSLRICIGIVPVKRLCLRMCTCVMVIRIRIRNDDITRMCSRTTIRILIRSTLSRVAIRITTR